MNLKLAACPALQDGPSRLSGADECRHLERILRRQQRFDKARVDQYCLGGPVGQAVGQAPEPATLAIWAMWPRAWAASHPPCGMAAKVGASLEQADFGLG